MQEYIEVGLEVNLRVHATWAGREIDSDSVGWGYMYTINVAIDGQRQVWDEDYSNHKDRRQDYT